MERGKVVFNGNDPRAPKAPDPKSVMMNLEAVTITARNFVQQTAQRCVEIALSHVPKQINPMKDSDVCYANACRHTADAIRREFGLEDGPTPEIELRESGG